jgi:hypothetical protein
VPFFTLLTHVLHTKQQFKVKRQNCQAQITEKVRCLESRGSAFGSSPAKGIVRTLW